MRLLAALAAAPGRPLTREQLLDIVWPHLNVNEDALSRAISQLRRALDDKPRKPAYVETVHKGGYCLIAPVRELNDDAPIGRGGNGSRGLRARLAVAASALAAVAVAAFLVTSDNPAGTSPAKAALVPIPLTSEFGREIDPAISRDGRRLAFTATTEAGYDLFWRTIGDDRSFRLTYDGQFAERPVWSPGGDRIAFLKNEAGGNAVYIVSLATARAKKLIDLRSWSFGLDWSPDGRTIACSDEAGGEMRGIVLIDVATRRRRALTRNSSARGDRMPVFAPDGRRLAFLRDAGLGLDRIMVADLSNPDGARAVLDRPQEIRGLDWDARGGALVYSARAAGRYGLWKVATAGGRPEAIATEGGDLFNPSVSVRSDLVAEALERDSDIWAAGADGEGGAPLIRSTRDDYDAIQAPASGRIAFVSERSGSPELWIAGAKGEEARQATRLGRARLRGPVWSRDGRRIAFQAEVDGYAAAYVVADGRPPVLVAGGGDAHHVPIGWGPAGDELLIASGSGSSWIVRRQEPASGRSTALNAVPARLAAVSGDGEHVYLISGDGTKLVRMSARTGASEAFALPGPVRAADAMRWAAGGLYLFVPKPGGTRIHRLKVSGGAAAFEQVALVPSFGHMSVTGDGRRILYTNERETSNDIVLLRL